MIQELLSNNSHPRECQNRKPSLVFSVLRKLKISYSVVNWAIFTTKKRSEIGWFPFAFCTMIDVESSYKARFFVARPIRGDEEEIKTHI